jgi:hypothetical protein
MAQWLNATDEAREAAILYGAALLASRIDSGEGESSLCVSWHRKLALDDGDETKQGEAGSVVLGDSSSVFQLSGINKKEMSRRADVSSIHALEQMVWSAFDVSKGVKYTKGLSMGSFYLMESCGKTSPACTASYMMAYQNMAAREWLMQLWRNVMSPSTEVAASLRRIDALLALNVSNDAKIQQRLDAEYTFLNQTSPIWNRYTMRFN